MSASAAGSDTWTGWFQAQSQKSFSSLVDQMLTWLRSMLFKQEMELTLVGLQNAGKTTLVNVIATGGFSEDMIPTVGFNMRKVTKGKVTIKLWDLGGQPRFRSMWERYCRGVSAIVYVVDSADAENIATSKSELHDLLAKPALEGIPTLVLGNKNDVATSIGVDELIERLELKTLANREVCCYSISAKNSINIDITMDWLIKHSKPASS
uniref:Uncharacterized protein n=1 Tax=Haptolina brevifila TaxID=156173 RepID=A0A7S2FQC2_9EUKA|mmetsp:Transcript_17524/g.35359  ORF Transcript_17524/g.35359 Transcript_17524/m.35359 type:complete len:209 (+) Transcript_17524:52-678(+)|eukprot:CAMPEP_0174717354 /NCGR_PEP_ID=MMETSP1094-20130205/26387_1 /TAXON_ID=156173 /ORGANISM="Chrysochromulina brevifilum, Strain UTEX LB 985" /LENGTH=208 /DNA_ID=CAMNT_0015917273 /DNA_START=52 /DNA_END=678 /DNA_ORIENTATION=+